MRRESGTRLQLQSPLQPIDPKLAGKIDSVATLTTRNAAERIGQYAGKDLHLQHSPYKGDALTGLSYRQNRNGAFRLNVAKGTEVRGTPRTTQQLIVITGTPRTNTNRSRRSTIYRGQDSASIAVAMFFLSDRLPIASQLPFVAAVTSPHGGVFFLQRINARL